MPALDMPDMLVVNPAADEAAIRRLTERLQHNPPADACPSCVAVAKTRAAESGRSVGVEYDALIRESPCAHS